MPNIRTPKAELLLTTAVAQILNATKTTGGKWRSRFVEQRMDGLYDEPRPGVPLNISDDKSEEVVTKTLESTLRGRTHWSARSMAKHLGSSHSKVSSQSKKYSTDRPPGLRRRRVRERCACPP